MALSICCLPNLGEVYTAFGELSSDGEVKYVPVKNLQDWDKKIRETTFGLKIMHSIYSLSHGAHRDHKFLLKYNLLYKNTTYKIFYDDRNYCYTIITGNFFYMDDLELISGSNLNWRNEIIVNIMVGQLETLINIMKQYVPPAISEKILRRHDVILKFKTLSEINNEIRKI